MPSLNYQVERIHHNSQCITFPEWVNLFTLCLAPLIAHIVSGTPRVTHLTHSRPQWYDHLCHYNPASIVWRYAAITDRRLRATRWNRNDLAATSAIFWTSKGWNGSEDMVAIAAPHLSRSPGHTRVNLVSVTMLKTVITTLQGISAAYSLIGTLAGTQAATFVDMSVDMVFFPLAVLGLLRLCAAIWLTEDFEYNMYISPHDGGQGKTAFPDSSFNYQGVPLTDSSNPYDPWLLTPFQPDPRFRAPRNSWPSRIFRTYYFVVLAGIWGVNATYMMPGTRGGVHKFTASSFIIGIFYLLFLTVAVALHIFYFVRGQTTTTVIPCISATWYKLYTLVVMGCMLCLLVLSSIESNRWPDGHYVTMPPVVELSCWETKRLMYFTPGSSLFGLTSTVDLNPFPPVSNYSSTMVTPVPNNVTTFGEQYWLWNFTGFAVGRFLG